jgi:glycine/D-amino acid oxidase-like deaminating enzyme
MSVCILGAGTAGLLLLLLLRQNIPPSRITIMDPYVDGGDLIRRWHMVISNTPLRAATEALQRHGISLPPWVLALDPDQPTPLSLLGRLLLDLARPALQEITVIQSTALSANYNSSTTLWEVSYTGGTLQAKTIVLATGGQPKTLGLPIPSIPLEVALDTSRLRSYLRPGQRVAVFGTRHSGTLVLRNCLDCSGTVTGIYKGPTPFQFARDGDYDGLKLDAASIADTYLSTIPASLSLVPFENTAALIKATRTADWVVYATGFQRAAIPLTIDSVPSPVNYDGKTGVIHGMPRAWGFGLAFPSQAPDGIHWDVGVAAFLDHIAQQVSAIVIS